MKYINESISEYVHNINTVEDLNGKGAFVYHRTDADPNNIRATGMSREFQGKNGQCFGPGLYVSLRLSDCIENRAYGHNLLKLWIPGFERCLIDPVRCNRLARKVFGDNCSVENQVISLVGEENIKYFNGMFNNISSFTSSRYEKLVQEFDIDGVIYDWGGGHLVCVWKDYKRVFPYAYSTDDGQTFKRLGDATTLKYTLNTWEPTRVFGNDFDKYENADNLRAENGYFLVKLKNGGYNYINPLNKNKLVSSVFFDLASQVDENGLAEVEYNGQHYWYDVNNDDVYKNELALDMGKVLCKSNGLKQLHETKVINEVLTEYVPNIGRNTLDNKNNDLTFFYRLSLPTQIESISKNGFSKEFRGSGNDNSDFLGSGTYGVVFPSNNTHVNYGNILWKYATPTELVKNTYISPDPYLARKFGIEGNFAEQLKRFFPDLYPKWKENGMLRRILAPTYSGSAAIRQLNDIAFRGTGGKSDYAYHSHGINGIIYNGNIDHNAVITFDDSTIIPIAWRDNAKPHDNWHFIEITDNLWDRTYNGYDPLVLLKGTYKNYNDDPNFITANYRVKNGYMLVTRKSDGKSNYVKAPEGGENFVSPIWFDNAAPIDKDGIGEVVLNNKRYYFTPEDGSLYKDELSLDMGRPTLNVHDGLKEDKGVFGNLLTEVLKK